MKRMRILVFPCGSEIGLEIHRSLRYSPHIDLFGASSIEDHGKFVYDQYIGGLPFIDHEDIFPSLKNIIKQWHIDAIYPTMDMVICTLKNHEERLGCRVIASPKETAEICVSKRKTYNALKGAVKVPKIYSDLRDVKRFPAFVKPEIGYGSRGCYKIENPKALKYFFIEHKQEDYLLTEYLPGKEYTVDCFSDRNRALRFYGPRIRERISNGISVNTKEVKQNKKGFETIAEILNGHFIFRGAWFFQVKEDENGVPTVTEIATRLGGSSSLYRGKGINFALLSILDAFDIDVEILENNYDIELDRALENKYRVNIDFSNVYVDFDDCILSSEKLNTKLIEFFYQARNQGKRIVLISKHEGDLIRLLHETRIYSIFDQIIQIDKNERKLDHITDTNGIFIDDSFSERKQIHDELGMHVFSSDMIETLLD